MKNKLFFGAFLLILSILGISIEQSPAHNQEITIFFPNNQKTGDNLKETIASLKEQLSALDITHFKVQQLDNAFKITYHSDVSVSKIKQVLSLNNNKKEEPKPLDSKFPLTPDTPEDYEIAIARIQNNTGFDGLSSTVVDYKYETTRSTDVKIYGSTIIDTFVGKELPSISHKITTVYSGVIPKTTSYNIPLVRAGPHC